MIETDSGGSNSAVSRAWKYHLQEKVSDRFGLIVTVCHYPTGASKCNPIEHRLFSEISKTWAGCPLRTFGIAAQSIRETKTQTGLTVRAHLVRKKYVTGEKISDEMMATLNITHHTICPQWNYTIYPRCLMQCGNLFFYEPLVVLYGCRHFINILFINNLGKRRMFPRGYPFRPGPSL